jgi:heptosyltransferase I
MSTPVILVVRLGAMGDILHTAPAVASLKRSYPGSRLVWAIEERWAPLVAGNPAVDALAFVNRRSLSALFELRRQLRLERFQFAVDFQGLIKSAIVAGIARPDRIYGLHRSSAREPLASLVYSHTCRPVTLHVVDRNLELASAAGAANLVRTAWVPAGAREGILPDRAFVLASPLAGWVSKQWPLSHYRDLAAHVRKELGLELVLNVPQPFDSRGVPLHVSGIGGLIDATRRAVAVVGVDSGPLHLAAALSKPGVAIYGPTDPARNGPYGGSLTVLRHPQAVTSYKRLDKIDASMRAITPAMVVDALRQRLS